MQHHPRVTTRAPLAVAAFAAVLALSACGGGGGGSDAPAPPAPAPTPTPPPPNPTPPPTGNRAPTAANDVLAVTGAGVASLNVLANDADPDNDALTVSITTPPTVGTAAVNANNSVAITGLPSGFRGVTRFTYQVRDPAGLTATANAAVFVDVPAFRLIWAGDEARSGAQDLYLSNLAGNPVKLGNATENALRLGGYAAARNGSTVAYTRLDPANAATTEEFWVVRTATPTAPTRVQLPAGERLIHGARNVAQYRVSDDGRWVAFVAGTGQAGAPQNLYLLDVTGTAGPVRVQADAITGAPEFAPDSRTVYFLSTLNGSTGATLRRVPVDQPSATVRVSAAGSATGGVLGYALTRDGQRVVAGRRDGGADSIVAIDATSPGTERTLSAAPPAGSVVFGGGIVLSPNGQQVVYATAPAGNADPANNLNALYSVGVSGTPAARVVATAAAGERLAAYEIAPGNAALLFLRTNSAGSRLFEVGLDGSGQVLVADLGTLLRGVTATYDGTTERVVFERPQTDPALPPTLIEVRASARNEFGGAGTRMGTANQFASVASFAGVERGVVILGQRPGSGSDTVLPTLVNARAPDRLLDFAAGSFNTGLTLNTLRVAVVDGG